MAMANPKTKNQTEEYIQLDKIFGYQRQIYLILSDRGFGKTFAMKVQFIKDFIRKGKKFIYLRRYKSEMKTIFTFFDDVSYLFPDHEFKIKGWNFYIDDKICGMGMVLTRYQDYKGGSYPEYDNLVFDEFLREKVGSVGYLNNDVEAFLSICDSVFRKRKGVRALCLANTVNESNPYFIDMKFVRKDNSEYCFSSIKELKNRTLCYIRDLDQETIDKNKNSSDFRAILGALPKYSNVALENKFDDSNNVFIKRKDTQAKHFFNIKVGVNQYLGVWINTKDVEMYVSKKHEPNSKNVYTFKKDLHDENTVLVNDFKQYHQLKKLVRCFKNSILFFDTYEEKKIMFDLFGKMRIF